MEIFNRIEQKYILNEKEYKELLSKIENHLVKDQYYKSKICNLYFDNDNNDLIINSLEKPIFKEKIRLRSYNVPNLNSVVFLEIKGKMNGIVFKRRIEIVLKDFYNYLETKKIKPKYNNQVMREIDYIIKKVNLKPKLFIGYDRLSYYDKDNINFRITFDTYLRSREDELRLELGDNGNLSHKDQYIMEFKSLDAIPLWFVKILSSMKIYPKSFSKYGEIYQEKKIKENINTKTNINKEFNLNSKEFTYKEEKVYV